MTNNTQRLNNVIKQFKAEKGIKKIYRGKKQNFFKLISFRVISQKRLSGKKYISISEATIQIRIQKELKHTASEGNGPVNSMDKALRKAVENNYPQLKQMTLIDYVVHVPRNNKKGTEKTTLVFIESSDSNTTWWTLGIHEDVNIASWEALVASFGYKIHKEKKK